ncbi:MAG: sialate O-acetylesterase [Verrucomicrobiota bacterium]
MKTQTLSLLFVLVLAPLVSAEVRVPSFFSDHMVLQSGQKVPVWGWAAPGEAVTVSIAGQTKKAKADKKGNWEVKLDALESSAVPTVMRVKGADRTITVRDVMVGEVWICSGQSNMQWRVSQAMNADEEIAAADHPGIRMFLTELHTAGEPKEDTIGHWAVCHPESVGEFSAVGYYFARELHEELGMPVGTIRTAWGGTRSEAWTSKDAIEGDKAAGPMVEAWAKLQASWDADVAQEKYEAALAKWEEQMEKVKAANAKLPEGEEKRRWPRRPEAPAEPVTDRRHPSAIYNAMIAPFAGYGVTGAIWYQGESNRQRAEQYRSIFPTMIADWRDQWGDEFSFYFVQLANFLEASTEPGTPSDWAELQEAQLMTLGALDGVGMAVANDIGAADDIHPTNKQEVGRRLALWALANDYGREDVVHSGPLFKKMRVKKGRVIIDFDHVGGGLAIRDGGKKLERFEIAGADQKWHWADAVIKGKRVIVSSAEVSEPVAVRYAWASNPEGANLVNKEGLPASLFRTDDWEGMTDGVMDPFSPAAQRR